MTSVSPPQIRRPAARLHDLATAILCAAGVPTPDALTISDVLIDAELRGIASHGLTRLVPYVARFESGAYVRRPHIRLTGERAALVHVDGGHGHGMVIAKFAMAQAVERARTFGIGSASVRNSGHFGTAGYYTRQAASHGCAALAFTNASAGLAPWNGMDAIVGNNPWSVAVPGLDGPICLDLANSVAARGKIRTAAERGTAIPEGWAVDENGEPTTDPLAALRGAILPIAGYKGYGITVMVEMLAALLSGAATLDSVVSPRDSTVPQDVGHLFIAIDVAALVPLPEFHDRVAAYVERLKTSKAAAGKEIMLPGEPEARALAQNSVAGIALGSTWDAVAALAEKYGVPTGP